MPKADPPNEDEVKRAAEIREWLEGKISELETELARLRDMQIIVDSVLRKTSFVPATELRSSQTTTLQKPMNTAPSGASSGERASEVAKAQMQAPAKQQTSSEDSRQLRRSKDGALLANAIVSPNHVVIVPSSDVKISQTIPPFQSFFVNRILRGYETKDQELVSNGKLPSEEALSFSVEERDGNISKVTVNNYREKARLNEILSTINWAFTRMLEKK